MVVADDILCFNPHQTKQVYVIHSKAIFFLKGKFNTGCGWLAHYILHRLSKMVNTQAGCPSGLPVSGVYCCCVLSPVPGGEIYRVGG